jgi:glycosyltransferase involved in cell wall biosynthesis
MRLLVVTNLFPNPLEPLRSTFNERQIAALARTAPLSVVCPVSWRAKLAYRSAGTLARLRACREWNGIPVRYPTYYYVPGVMAWSRGWTMTASILGECLAAVRRDRPQAILATWAFPDGFAAVVVGRLTGLPVVIKVHGTDVENLTVGALRRRLSIWALARARRVVSVSRHLRDELVGHGIPADRVAIVHNGVDAETFQARDRSEARRELGTPLDARIVLFVGSLKVDKGVLDLFDPRVVEAAQVAGARIVIIGDGPLRRQCEREIAQRSLESRVALLGGQRPAQIAEWMNAADCLCLPSHHEGRPNVILEALCCGLPVLATGVGGIPEIVNEQNGILVGARRPGELARGITAFFARQWDRAAVRRTSPARSWAASAAALEKEIAGSAA